MICCFEELLLLADEEPSPLQSKTPEIAKITAITAIKNKTANFTIVDFFIVSFYYFAKKSLQSLIA
jgi:hypothetical protein